MDDEGEMWTELPKFSEGYMSGVRDFIRNAFSRFSIGDEITCPCKNCKNYKWRRQDTIYDHLVYNGPCPMYAKWMFEISRQHLGMNEDMDDTGTNVGDNLDELFHRTVGNMQNLEDKQSDGPSVHAEKLYRRFEEGKQPLYPGCTKFTSLSFIIRLYSLKCVHGITESGFGDLLELIREAFPQARVPLSFNAAKAIIKDLGLDYQRIHACPNDCMIYWGVNEKEDACRTCGVSRWIIVEKKGAGENNLEKVISKVPAKVMRYFPLKPRLQRMFMSKEYSELMIWHAVGRKTDGKLRHPADAEAWKTLDAKYPMFSSEKRNIRLGVAADGFSPFRTMNTLHSTWPIVLVNYNLPPWLCMKTENLILSTIIPGPESPKNNIDIYMQPLISELKELWELGTQTYDAFTDQSFNLRATVLWTISDFPGYAMLSGWSTKGKLACPVCHYETSSMYLKNSKKMCYMSHRKFLDVDHKWRFDKKRFNGEIELGTCPDPLTGTEIMELLAGFENRFGKNNVKKVKTDSPFKKKSIFFELPYWSHNLCRHNLDVMHIEKNICDKIIGTLLNIGGKSKDHLNARKDLQEMGIRKVLHPVLSADGKHIEFKAAIFDMTNREKDLFCSVLQNAKLPYGCAANVRRYVSMDERKVMGYKSHDAHFILHYLLQFAVKKALKPEVALPLIRFGRFLRDIWSKAIDLDELRRLQNEIAEVLCQFEMIFSLAFFDIMVHLPVHLCKEIEWGGPADIRCMYSIERYLCKLKSYVRSKSKPEASIAEGYLVEECLIFCSRFLGYEGAGKITTSSAKFESSPQKMEYPIGTRRNKEGKAVHLKDSQWQTCHRYILFNCGNKEIENLIE